MYLPACEVRLILFRLPTSGFGDFPVALGVNHQHAFFQVRVVPFEISATSSQFFVSSVITKSRLSFQLLMLLVRLAPFDHAESM